MINLKQQYGDTYRVDVDESHYADRQSTQKRSVSPWNYILKGKKGHVYLQGENQLAVATNYRGQLPQKLIEIGAKIIQDGSDGVNATFDAKLLPKVARLCGLYRKKRLSEERKTALRNQLAKMRAKQ